MVGRASQSGVLEPERGDHEDVGWLKDEVQREMGEKAREAWRLGLMAPNGWEFELHPGVGGEPLQYFCFVLE